MDVNKLLLLMRVLFCKVHCPSFICFCKPSSHLLTPCPLKLENGSNVPTTVCSVPDSVGEICSEKVDDQEEVEDKGSLDERQIEIEILPKSSLKKPNSEPRIQVEKARVQWMDLLGKDLVEIKEFEPSESGESDDDDESTRGCVCVIQ